MVEDSQRSFTDRTMDHYIKKHRREDKDPHQIEFEKQKQECTFKPSISMPKEPSPLPRAAYPKPH